MTRTRHCPECGGQGWQIFEGQHKDGVYDEYTDDCTNCGGSGEVEDDEYENERGDWLLHKRQDEEMDRG